MELDLDWMEKREYDVAWPRAYIYFLYAQQGTWGDLVAAILDGGADLNRKVWLDILAVRQWPSDTLDLNFLLCVCTCVLLCRGCR